MNIDNAQLRSRGSEASAIPSDEAELAGRPSARLRRALFESLVRK
jgi:hypothetical protein